MPWVNAPGYPKKLAPVLVPIEQYKSEAIPVYNERVWRWRTWFSDDRPMMWYAKGTEVQSYEEWAAKERAAV